MGYFEDELARLDTKVSAYQKLKAGFEAEIESLRPERRRLSWRVMEGKANAAVELKVIEDRIDELQTAIRRVPNALDMAAEMRENWLKRQGEFDALQGEFDALHAERPDLLNRIDTLTSELEKAIESYLTHNVRLTAAADRVRDRLATSLRKSGDRLYIYLNWKLLRFDTRADRTAASGFFRRASLAEIEGSTLAPEAPAPDEPAAEPMLIER